MTTFTEDQIYMVIDIWYKGEELFKLIARGLVKKHLSNGLDINDDFIFDMIKTHDEWGGR
jgi:hypothetical protein